MSRRVYFASDFHLGVDCSSSSTQERELWVKSWFDRIEEESTVYLLGDIFDYWFEYHKVIPSGYSRFFQGLRNMLDRDVQVEIYTGNHDSWMFDYFEIEFGIPVHHQQNVIDLQGKRILLGHGDGLGPGDKKYKIIKKLFRNPLAQRIYRYMHPDLGLRVMASFSHSSRDSQDNPPFMHEDEWLVQYARHKLSSDDYDYFIFGHRHLVIDYRLGGGSRYLNCGDWMHYQSYIVLEDGEAKIKFFNDHHTINTNR